MSRKKKVFNILINILLSIGIVFCVACIIFKACFIEVTVNGTSMNPNIEDGTKGFMIKVKHNTKIQRFDVVVSKYYHDDYYIIKRVLGLPGEEITLKNNVLYVNQNEVEQNFKFIPQQSDFIVNSWTLKENEYLLVGDNRANTVAPAVENIDNILAKNGFSYQNYDIYSSKCENQQDYSACPIENHQFYWLKEGMAK